jgi:hypothetical protein
MTIFEHSFTLIGLVLGLALAEVLSGLVRTARSRGVRALGVLTPLLAIFFVADVATFWGILWGLRATLPDSIWPVLGIGILLSSLYYIAGTLVFPGEREQAPDLDAYYMKSRRLVLGLMLPCFVTVTAIASVRAGELTTDIVGVAYTIVLSATILAPWKWANIAGLSALILVDIWAFFS